MNLRGLAAASSVAVGVVVAAHPASAAVDGGDAPGGTVTVGASGAWAWSGSPGGSGAAPGGAAQRGGPWLCTYTSLTLNDGPGFAPGGPTPGGWYSVTCADQATGATSTVTEWIANGSATPTPAVDPYAVARQAENVLQLPPPTINVNPSAVSVVNLPTWLWIDADMWHSYSVTASVGPVSATAVATPTEVTWSMGDGSVVLCDGPGTPYDPTEPAPRQSTRCAHAYAVSSAGQPSPDGNANDGAFGVRATIDWSVSWSVTGAVGGGSLPALSTSTSTTVRVEQVESVDSDAPILSAALPSQRGWPR